VNGVGLEEISHWWFERQWNIEV